MKKVARQIAALFVLLLLFCLVGRLATGNAYTVYMPIPSARQGEGSTDYRLVVEAPEVLAPGSPDVHRQYVKVPIRPRQHGETLLSLTRGEDDLVQGSFLRVGRFLTVYDFSTGGFTGDSYVLVAFTVFCLAVGIIMLRFYLQARGPAFYAYTTIFAAGFSLFSLLTGALMVAMTVQRFIRPDSFSMLNVYSVVSSASYNFTLVTLPFMLAFAAAMALSNAALLRHEGFHPKNLLGIGVALLLVVGELALILLYTRNFSGSEWEYRVHETLLNVCATVFAYFECMLIGAIVCGVRAARHVPAADADYLIILGCRFRRDGTLTPLLQGRVDRALDFWRRQKAATGREAVLIPSGGQGADEVISEAEAMRRYLLAQGVPERLIRAEDRSRNTYENMANSRALIEAERPGAKAVYVTTNYHVFRSGVWASLAGLPAEGVGSRTKWWYWPNAFMRECAGLLRNRLPQELLLLLVALAFFGALSLTLI